MTGASVAVRSVGRRYGQARLGQGRVEATLSSCKGFFFLFWEVCTSMETVASLTFAGRPIWDCLYMNFH